MPVYTSQSFVGKEKGSFDPRDLAFEKYDDFSSSDKLPGVTSTTVLEKYLTQVLLESGIVRDYGCSFAIFQKSSSTICYLYNFKTKLVALIDISSLTQSLVKSLIRVSKYPISRIGVF